MNALDAMQQLELAAYELAEATSHERQARRLRSQAARRVGSVQAEINDAAAQAIQRSTKKENLT